MGHILISFDYGRRAEYLTSFALSPYAITIPFKGQDDRVESDFLCIGLEKKGKAFIPSLRLIFWVETKSQSSQHHRPVIIKSPSEVKSILDNKMPYFIAIVNTKSSPGISLYETSERITFTHMYPYAEPKRINFIPGMPKDGVTYHYDQEKALATIYMREPLLKLNFQDSYERVEKLWKILKMKIEMDYSNFIYASVGLGYYKRLPLPWVTESQQDKIFYPLNGRITEETHLSIGLALEMLSRTLIENERKRGTDSAVVKAIDTLISWYHGHPS